jgi:F0F1-type ATP synthase beta subunit
MDELSEDDKLPRGPRPPKIQKFLSQPFFVAEQFTGHAGRVRRAEGHHQGFKEIVDGKHDDLPELGPVSADDEGFMQKKAEVERAATKLMLK